MEDIVKQLRELEGMVMQCMKCGTCQAHCPLYQKDHTEQSVARGKISLIQAVYEGRLEEAATIYSHLDYCIMCGRCAKNCPSGVKTNEIFLRARTVLRKIKKMPGWQRFVLKLVMERPDLLARIAPLMHIGMRFGSKKVKDDIFRPLIPGMGGRATPSVKKNPFATLMGGWNEADSPRHRVIFYPGCAVNMISTSWGTAIVETLNMLGVSVYVPPVNRCCGIPAATMGDSEQFRENLGRNFEEFRNIEASHIITCCPTCEYAFRDRPGLENMDESPIPPMDILVFLDEVIGLDITAHLPENARISLHMPCHYRHDKEDTAIRAVSAGTDAEYVPLDNQNCCGFGGTFSLKHYKRSKPFALSKADEVQSKNITILATPCPGCAMQLTDGLAAAGSECTVRHPVEFIHEELVRAHVSKNQTPPNK